MQRKASFDSLFKRFLAGVEKTKNIDYLDRKSIKRNNVGVDQYRKAAKQIGEMYPEYIEKFACSLCSEDIKERTCCAICMIELMDCSHEQNIRAYSVLKDNYESSNDKVEKMMFEAWLGKYINKIQGVY